MPSAAPVKFAAHEHLADDQAEAERGHRQVMAAQPQRRVADQQRDQERHEHGAPGRRPTARQSITVLPYRSCFATKTGEPLQPAGPGVPL